MPIYERIQNVVAEGASVVDLTRVYSAISAVGTASLNADLVARLATLDPSVNPCVVIGGKGASGDQGGGTFVGVLVAGGPAIDNAMVFASSNALWRWKRVYTDHLSPAWWGAYGGGGIPETAALQAALDATITYGVPLRCEAGATYLVRKAGATWNGYALKFKSGTRLDLNGATIKLDNDQWCSTIINEHVSGGGPDHIEIGNGIIDGNEAGQSRHWTGAAWNTGAGPGGVALTHTPTLLMINLDAPIFADLTILNGYVDAMQIQSATRPYFDGITIDGCWGDGHIIKDCTDVFVNDLSVSNLPGIYYTPSWGSAAGQGIIWKLVRGSVGTVTLTNCHAPAKVQVSTTDLVWDKLFCIAGPLTCLPYGAGYPTWWGIKLQGDAPGTPNIRVKFNVIVCDASDPAINFATQSIGCGLYINNSSDVEIVSFTAICCGRGYYVPPAYFNDKDYYAIFVLDAPHLKIGRLTTDRCDGGVIASQHSTGVPTEYIDIDEILAIDPQYSTRAGATVGATLLSYIFDCHLRVGRVRLLESVAPAFPTGIIGNGVMATDFTASIHIDELVTNQPLHAGMFSIVPDADIARITIGRIRVDGLVGRSEGVQTLTNGSPTTAVTAEEISSWDTLNPIISVHPINASAAALGTPIVAPAGAPATGFQLGHGVAGVSDIVSWKNLGYSSLAGLAIPREWSVVAPTGGIKPSARWLASMCYVPTLGVSLLFGGSDSAGADLNDLWQFNHLTRTWTQLFPATSPSARWGFLMAYDSVRDRVVLWGGRDSTATYFTDTWEYYAGNWHAVATAHAPDARQVWSSCNMAFDPSRGVCVTYGGPDLAHAHWWEYNGVDWASVGGALANGVYNHSALVYNPVLARVVLHGGYSGVGVSDDEIYEWDGVAATGGYVTPYGSMDHFLVWDSLRNLAVLAGIDGGGGGGGLTTTTLELTGHSLFTAVDPMPTPRTSASAVYCPTMAEVLAFGGSTDGTGAHAVDTTIVLRRG